MIVWDILNTTFRVGIALIIVWKFWRFWNNFNRFERAGMAFAGGAAVMTINVIWELERSPFDGWSNTLFSAGMFLYFCGRAYRHLSHDWRNRRMAQEGQQYLRERGR